MLAAGRESYLWNAILFIPNLVHAIHFKIKGWEKIILFITCLHRTQQEIEIKSFYKIS